LTNPGLYAAQPLGEEVQHMNTYAGKLKEDIFSLINEMELTELEKFVRNSEAPNCPSLWIGCHSSLE